MPRGSTCCRRSTGHPRTGSFTPSSTNQRTELIAVDVADGRAVTLVDSGDAIEFTLEDARWTLTDAIAASGFEFDGALVIDVRFIDTPHQLRVTCHPETGNFEAAWVTEPLHRTRLRDLRMPVL